MAVLLALLVALLLAVPARGGDRVALDRVLAAVDKSQIIPKNVEGVKADPPPIFFSQTPAILVNIDGDPIWSPIKDNDLKYAINTNWDLFEHAPSKTFFLRNNDTWLKANRSCSAYENHRLASTPGRPAGGGACPRRGRCTPAAR